MNETIRAVGESRSGAEGESVNKHAGSKQPVRRRKVPALWGTGRRRPRIDNFIMSSYQATRRDVQ